MTNKVVVLAVLVVASIIAIVVAVLVVDNRGESAPGVLAQAADELRSISSVRITIVGIEHSEFDGERQVTSEIVFESGRAFSTRGTAADGQYEEQIIVGDTRYTRFDPTGDWTVEQGFELSIGPDTLSEMVSRHVDLASSDSAVLVGDELIDGVPTTHLVVETDMVARATEIWPDPALSERQVISGMEIPRAQFEAGAQTVNYWIGVDDGLVYQIDVVETFPAYGGEPSYGNEYRVSFSDYNRATVSAPALTQP